MRLARIVLLTGRCSGGGALGGRGRADRPASASRDVVRPRRAHRRRGAAAGRARQASTSSRSRVAPPVGWRARATCTARSRRTSSPGGWRWTRTGRAPPGLPCPARGRSQGGGRCSSGSAAGSRGRWRSGRPGTRPGVLAECRAGLRDLAVHRSVLPTIELRALASGHGAELGEIGLGVVLAGASPARALAWMERTRAAALSTRLPSSEAPVVDRRRAVPSAGGGVPRRARAWARTCTCRCSTGPRRPGAPHEGRARCRGCPALAATREALDGRTSGRVREVRGSARGGRRRPATDPARRAGRRAGRRDRAAAAALRPAPAGQPPRRRRGGRRPRERRPADRPAAGPAHRAPGRRATQDELVVVPVGMLHGVPWSCLHDGPLARRRRPRSGSAPAARRSPGTVPAGRSSWPVRT